MSGKSYPIPTTKTKRNQNPNTKLLALTPTILYLTYPNRNSQVIKTYVFLMIKSIIPSQQCHVYKYTVHPGLLTYLLTYTAHHSVQAVTVFTTSRIMLTARWVPYKCAVGVILHLELNL